MTAKPTIHDIEFNSLNLRDLGGGEVSALP